MGELIRLSLGIKRIQTVDEPSFSDYNKDQSNIY